MVDELWGDLLNMNAKDPAYVLCQTRNTPYLTSDRPLHETDAKIHVIQYTGVLYLNMLKLK